VRPGLTSELAHPRVIAAGENDLVAGLPRLLDHRRADPLTAPGDEKPSTLHVHSRFSLPSS
jgi:hypothetical protein